MTDSDTRGWRSSLRRHDVLVFTLVAESHAIGKLPVSAECGH